MDAFWGLILGGLVMLAMAGGQVSKGRKAISLVPFAFAAVSIFGAVLIIVSQ